MRCAERGHLGDRRERFLRHRAPGEVGTPSWSAGPASTQLAEVDTLAGLRDTLDTLRFTPAPGFEGRARLDAVIDELGNSGSGGAKSDSDTRLVKVGPAADIVRYDVACLLAVAEGGTLRLAFAREGGQGQENLSFESGGGSAMPGVDFPLDPPLTLSWTFAETGVKSRVLPITQDAIAEGSEDFVLVAGATGGFTYVGAPIIGVNIRTALGAEFIFGDGAEGECPTN